MATRGPARALLPLHLQTRYYLFVLLFWLHATIIGGGGVEHADSAGPSDTLLLISASARIHRADQQTFVAELPIMVLGRESQTSQSVFLMIGTVFGGRNTSEYVSQEQKSFMLGDLEENMNLRMELPWNLLQGRCRLRAA